MSERNTYDTCLKANVSNLCIRSAIAAAAAAALCVATLLLLQLLLLFVMVCRMAKLLLWSIVSDSSVFFLFIQTRYTFMYPLVVLSHLRPRFAYYNTSSAITGIRGAKAGVSPPRRSLPVYQVHISRKKNNRCALAGFELTSSPPKSSTCNFEQILILIPSLCIVEIGREGTRPPP